MGSESAPRARKRASREKQYNKALKTVEQTLAATQRDLEEKRQQQELCIERNLVLSELLYCSERLQNIYQKQLAWLAAAEGDTPDTTGPHSSAASSDPAQPGQINSKLLDEQLQQDAHWVLYLLETATCEQVQQARRMTCADWGHYHRDYCNELIRLMEVTKRCPEVQGVMLEGAAPPKQALESMPTAAAVLASSSSAGAAPSASSISSDAVDREGSPPALHMIVHLLKTTGTLAYLALLHGMSAIFLASPKNVLTGEDSTPPLTHWANVARRMRLSRQQKLHFKLALQNFARQARAAAAQGLSVIQEAPSYAFLLACELIASSQLSSSSEEGSAQPQTDSEAATQPSRGNAAAAAGPHSSHAGPASRAAAAASTGDCGTAGGSGAAAGGAGAGAGAGDVADSGSGSFAPAATAGAAAAALGLPPVAGAAGPEPRQQQQQQEAPAAAMDEGEDDDEGPPSPTKRLQHQVGLYYRQLVNLNIFLADTLTLEQALVLNVASYPFWPNLSAVAEAALQLPDDEDPGSQEELHGVQVLMQKRRSFMQHAHYQWWSDYGQPGAQLPPQ